MALFWPGSPFCAEDPAAPVRAVRVAGVINPVIADFITAELAAANAGNARAFMIELDTPGGLDSAMRTIIQQILGSRLPVIVYISPSGARAASAGAPSNELEFSTTRPIAPVKLDPPQHPLHQINLCPVASRKL